jgi:rhodanese-related sulfurtransferase
MIDAIKKLLGIGPATDFAGLVKSGAIILDVRTKGEYSGGHIKGSINVPLNQLDSQIGRFPNKEKPIITCCASGMRSSTARNLLKSAGYTQVFNGGSWTGLQYKIV